MDKYCSCLTPVNFTTGIGHFCEEVYELYKEPSLDELSDCSYALGRLTAGIFGKNYFTMPFDKRHRTKIQKRMEEYGCVRSARHLIEGKCPSIKI